MPQIPVLKKKLKSVKATGKLSKAMKTVSAAKYSRLSSLWRDYSLYTDQYRFLYTDVKDSANLTPDAIIVMGSNRGFCGSFNNDVVSYYMENRPDSAKTLIVCGEEIIKSFSDSGLKPDYTFVFGEVPTFDECGALFDCIAELSDGKENFAVEVINPKYINTLNQEPVSDIFVINQTDKSVSGDVLLYVPDRSTVLDKILEKGFRALMFSKVLETALGAQASTLMTMRSAYDTATDYTETLEGEIHRLRQSAVTSDVIETAADHGAKEENENG